MSWNCRNCGVPVSGDRCPLCGAADPEIEDRQRRAQMERRRDRLEAERLEAERLKALKEAREKAAQDRLLAEVLVHLESDFLDGESLADAHASAAIWREARRQFVTAWARSVEGISLDEEQAAAVGAQRGDQKLIARAGSGKTRVLTARALFLQERCGVHPNEILLLAFNRNAASEMLTRIRERAREAPHVMTFHALAHALVKPEEELLYDDPSAGVLKRSRAMQKALQWLIDQDGSQGWPLVKRVMSRYFRADLERIVAGGLELGEKQGLAYRRELVQESLKGDFVKSYGEKRIANALFENDVDYRYEAVHEWSDGSPYRPDFTIWKSKVVIEYFGMAGDPEYDEATRQKKAFWEAKRKEGWTLIALDRLDQSGRDDQAFETHLVSLLQSAGVPTHRLSNAEIWAKCRERSIERLTEAIAGVLSRVRAEGLSVEQLRERADALSDPDDALFARAAGEVLGQYEAICAREELDDFSGLLWRAVEAVRNGKTTFSRNKGRETGDLRRLRFVLVDELQDLTPGFHALLRAMRVHAPEISILGVGDDWQAITRYAGADPRLFAEHPGPVDSGARMHLTTNYRSDRAIVAAGNSLMRGRGEPASADKAARGRVALVRADELSATPVERHTFGDDTLTPTLLRILQDRIGRGQRVTLLARNNTLPSALGAMASTIEDYLEQLRQFLPRSQRDRLSASTVHRFKGKEDDVVVILDAIRGRYPFMHPEWAFYRVLGDTEQTVTEDERRLFYVALTRGRHETLLMAQTGNVGDFVLEIDPDVMSGTELSGLLVPEPLIGTHEALVIRGGYDNRYRLAELGFALDRRARAWWMVAPADELTQVQRVLGSLAAKQDVIRQPAELPLAPVR